MMERWFRLRDNQTSVRVEVSSGVTVFLTALYILFVNRVVMVDAGMPPDGVFIATALSAAICTLFMALYANLPFTVAPGMSLNAFFTYTICLGAGYHWKEALAITFLAGTLHAFLMLTPARKSLIAAIPEHIGLAAGAAMGLLIAYIAVKNTGIFSDIPNIAKAPNASFSLGDFSFTTFLQAFNPTHLIPIVAAGILLLLLSFEQKTGERFAALPVSILAATFLCLPITLERIHDISSVSGSALAEFWSLCFSFFGVPGLGSIFASPAVAAKTLLIIILLALTNILDSLGTIMGIGYAENANLFERHEMELFRQKYSASRLDRALIANSFGGMISPLLGASTAVVYLESSAAVLTGGRTGLSGMVTGILFLLCIPIAGFFRIIPVEAVAPVMIYVGATTMARLRNIHWGDLSEFVPTFLTVLFVPLTGSILDGMCIGILSYVMINIATGTRKKVHPALLVIGFAYILTKIAAKFV